MTGMQAKMMRAAIIGWTLSLAVLATAVSEWRIHLHWWPGQELVYRGEVHEFANGRGVQYRKEYGLEIRALALSQRGEELEVAFLTVLRPKAAGPANPDAGTVRLALAWVTAQAEVIAPNRRPPQLSLDGPTTWECGFLVPITKEPWKAGHSWIRREAGQPAEEWRVVGTENLAGTTCLKLSRIQKSDDWEKPRADQRAWYRREVIWLDPRLGIAQRVEREISRREPAQVQATGSIITRFELVSSLNYEPRLLDDCKREIRLAAQLQDQFQDLLTPGRKASPEDFHQLARRAEQACAGPATPFRLALQRLAQAAQAAAKGEMTLVSVSEPAPALEVGKAAPDFLVPDWRSGQNVALRGFRGRPLLLLFLQARSILSGEVLLYAQRLAQQYPEWEICPVALFMDEDREAAEDLILRRAWNYPVLVGRALRASYQVEATPRLVLIDGQGVVQGQYTGWGPEIPQFILRDLRRISQRK
ncbi:MAG: redoxin domain-containing protein [Gemmatales bacterium]|nr:redoxin domain-containing protein [Gemmatales bacterium]MDW8224009.1 hypothetical protein [Gemmatales bacterium]